MLKLVIVDHPSYHVPLVYPDVEWTLTLDGRMDYDIRPYIPAAIDYLRKRIAGTALGGLTEAIRQGHRAAGEHVPAIQLGMLVENVGKWMGRGMLKDLHGATHLGRTDYPSFTVSLRWVLEAINHLPAPEAEALHAYLAVPRHHSQYIIDCSIAWLRGIEQQITQQHGLLPNPQH